MRRWKSQIRAFIPGRWRDRPGSLGVVVALAGAVLLVAVGSGYTASRSVLHDGSAWLTRGKGIVHVNAATGRPDAEVARGLAQGDEALQVVQTQDGNVYVVNRSTNEVKRIDLATMAVDPNAAVAPAGRPTTWSSWPAPARPTWFTRATEE